MEPYSMVFINTILLITLLIFIFTYKFILKRNINLLYFVVLFALLPLVSIFRVGVYQSGDFAINIEKTIDLYNSLSYGIFPVHWASLLNATYGYPLFIFTYPLPYYTISFFHFLGFSFILSEKVALSCIFLIGGVAMYLLLKHFLKPLSAFTGTLLYLFAPYHLIDLHFRTDIGEVFAITFIPLILLFVAKFVKKSSILNFSGITISYTLLILSHQAVALTTTPFLLAIPFFLKNKLKPKLYLAFLTGILLSTFYWLPVLILLKYTNQPLLSKVITFENPFYYLLSPWRFGMLYQGQEGQLAFPFGFMQIILVLVAIFFLIKRKIEKKFIRPLQTLLFCLALLIFMLLPISKPLWQTLPFVNNFQFSYRLMTVILILLAIVGAIVIDQIRNKFYVYAIIFLAVLFTILNWGNRAMLPTITDNYLIKHAPFSTYQGEGLNPASPLWTNHNLPWMKNPPKNHLEVINGNSEITQIRRTPDLHIYKTKNASTTSFVENTIYFPGWNVFVDRNKIPIQYGGNNKGIIHFSVPKGDFQVEVKYVNLPIFKISELISIATLLFLVFLNCYSFFHNRK